MIFVLGSPPYDLIKISATRFKSECKLCPFVSEVQRMAPAVAAWHAHDCPPPSEEAQS